MRILLTIDAVGGVWQYGLDLARGLAQRGVEPVLALMGPAPDAAQRAEVQAIDGVTLVETGLPLDWLCQGPFAVLGAGAEIAGLAQTFGADLIHLNSPALAAAKPPGIPLVAVTHGCISTWWEAAKPGVPLDESLMWHRELMRTGLRAADRVVAPTASYARLIARQYALPDAPLVVHNGRASLVAEHAPLALEERVLTVGRLWDSVKRADLLDRVAVRLTIPFDAAGQVTGPQGEHVSLTHLNLLGQIDGAALGRRLARCPVFVSAASFEPFGLSVLEAANASCALVLSDIDSFRELWGDAALFVAGDDAGAYVAAIESLIADPDLRLRLGAAACERAARYTPAAMADGMLAIYADLLGRHPASRRAAA
jgi:phosphatidylinositol alpha-mannosyltransferase